MRFLLPRQAASGDWPESAAAYVTGLDGRVYPGRVEVSGSALTFTRAASDSGKLHVAWPVAGFGRPVLTTTSLPENAHPYLLTLELARGKICELRDQAFQWHFAGMQLPKEFELGIRKAFQLFSRASASRSVPETADALAQQALELACQSAAILGRAYTEQRSQSRKQSFSSAPALLGCMLDETGCRPDWQADFFDTFSAAAVPIEWLRVEPAEGNYCWDALDGMVDCCQRRRCVVRGGPLLDLSPGGLPSWLAPWAADFLNLQSFVCDFIETAVGRYAGRIRMWEVCARGNSGGGLPLSEEQRLAIAARAIEAAQRTDTEAQIFIRIDQPWGEYQAGGGYRLTPFQFVDALTRSRLGLSGVNLEIAIGYTPGDQSRDLLSISRLIDIWSLLGISLHVTLALPSQATPDPQAAQRLRVARSPFAADWSPELQSSWAQDFVALLMSKPQVTGVFWSHFQDSLPHRFPHAGVVGADLEPKPLLAVLREMQAVHHPKAPAVSDSKVLELDGTWVDEQGPSV